MLHFRNNIYFILMSYHVDGASVAVELHIKNLPSGPSNVTSGWMLDSFRSSFLTFAESYLQK